MGLDQYVNIRRPQSRNNMTGAKWLSDRKLRKMSKRRRKAALRDANSTQATPRAFFMDWPFQRLYLCKARKPARTWYRLVSDDQELLYWRKFNPLQGWFEQHYDIDNCGAVNITTELLNRLEADMLAGNLHSTSGFFYGGEWEQSEIIDRLNNDLPVMRQALAEGERIYYTCWY